MKNIAVAFVAVVACCLWAVPCHAQHRLLKPAWDAFEASNYAEAVKLADTCIDDYAITTSKMETDLESKHAPDPPTGPVSAEQKQEILSRGPLNDAAACYFIKGRSNQSLKRNKEALATYTAGCQLRYARVWDARGWFWAPTEEMCARPQALTNKEDGKKQAKQN